MATYAALVSLMHTIEQIQHHPRPPISLDKTQLQSLNQRAKYLQEFLEGDSHVAAYSKEADDLEIRIADAAYAAEDGIESQIVDQILAASTSHVNSVTSVDLYEGLQKVIQDMDSIMIKKEVMEVTEKSTSMHAVRSSASTGQNIIVGITDVLNEMVDKLTRQQSGSRQIIPIVGMGGIGKTTLAKQIYKHRVVEQHFDILAWGTISQEYRMREFFLELLQEREESSSQVSEQQLGVKLHKRLSGRRYLVVIDDIWDIDVWDQLQLFFPNINNGSRILLTTRLSNLASKLAGSNGIEMGFLNEGDSWDLFHETVLGKECCPFELKEIGQKIVRSCKGLPLSIGVIGGLLAKTERKPAYWEWIGENLSSVVNSEDNESCLKILHLSYTQLPIYLKPCFLYMGVFSEDRVIRVSTLVKLWVAEGFLRPIEGKSLEMVAKEYLKDLIDRNLVVVHQLGYIGSIKFCNIHDLLRDLCLREARKERFYYVTRQHSPPQCINDERRILVLDRTSRDKVEALESRSLARSLIWGISDLLPSLDVTLLRILQTYDKHSPRAVGEYFLEDMFKFVNMRYIAFESYYAARFAPTDYLPWNLHTINVYNLQSLTAPSGIWNLPQLRHVVFGSGFYLPDPASSCVGGEDGIVLENLQKLAIVINFGCGEETVRRIPNISNLKLRYEKYVVGSTDYCLNNLERLCKLESFVCDFTQGRPDDSPRNLTFPRSLKKLTLKIQLSHHWEDVMEKIGSLPLLEKLWLSGGLFHGNEWETVEEQFCRLKFLRIGGCRQLKYWTTESAHFPCLECLVLDRLMDLKEIPLDIGEIPTLQLIEVIRCSESAAISAEEILVEQQQNGNENNLQVKVTL